MIIKRGDIYYADLRPVIGSEQGGVRPVLIIQNDTGNRHSPTVICAAITSRMNKAKLPTHVELDAERYKLVKNSVVLLEQVRTIDKKRLKEKVCHLDDEILKKVDRALSISLELDTYFRGCLVMRQLFSCSGKFCRQDSFLFDEQLQIWYIFR